MTTITQFISSVRRRALSDGQFPVLMVLLGVSIVLLTFGGKYIGFANYEYDSRKMLLITLGIGLSAAGIYLDLFRGQRYFDQWFRQTILDVPSITKFSVILVQLGLLVLLLRGFNIENLAFYQSIMTLVFFGFIIHFLLPDRFRPLFFLILSVGAFFSILKFDNGVVLIGIGLILISIAHLPIAFRLRVVILMLAGILLALLRAGLIYSPWTNAFWPILGSIFMFRLIIYMYDLSHESGSTNISFRLSYFFMLPNAVFPFFPVIDFRTFQRTYFNEDQFRIYQKGLNWILRGTLHLIAYRFVSVYVLISPSEIASLNDLARFMGANFLLYLKISGQFHIIVGILHLFGFNLPETHLMYFLASSFTDLWRRINIYWKDFMQKVFFYPSHFKMRRWGETIALIFSSFIVFIATWILHSYQWFWLRGTFLLSVTDILFWTILFFFMVVSLLSESKRGRKLILRRSSTNTTFEKLKTIFPRTIKTTSMFITMSILWSLWTSPTVNDWIAWWIIADITFDSVLQLLPYLLLLFMIFGIIIWREEIKQDVLFRKSNHLSPSRSVIITGGVTIFFVLISTHSISSLFDSQSQIFIRSLQVAQLSNRDEELLLQGYYEDLTGVQNYNSQLWELYIKLPDERESIWNSDVGRKTGDFQRRELVPSVQIIFKDKQFTTNRWGMRDQEYTLEKPPNTFRIALVGASVSMGWGVADDETFEWLVEERLNRENTGSQYDKYEILNFSVEGYSPVQQLYLLESVIPAFDPDAILYIAHPDWELDRSLSHIARMIKTGINIPYDYLSDLVNDTGISEDSSEIITVNQLKPFSYDILSWVYQSIARIYETNNVPVIIVIIPDKKYIDPSKIPRIISIAQNEGIIVFDMMDVFHEYELSMSLIQVAEWDRHPNSLGHQIIADLLFKLLLENQDQIDLGLFSP